MGNWKSRDLETGQERERERETGMRICAKPGRDETIGRRDIVHEIRSTTMDFKFHLIHDCKGCISHCEDGKSLSAPKTVVLNRLHLLPRLLSRLMTIHTMCQVTCLHQGILRPVEMGSNR